jgi:hypothetical protein
MRPPEIRAEKKLMMAYLQGWETSDEQGKNGDTTKTTNLTGYSLYFDKGDQLWEAQQYDVSR